MRRPWAAAFVVAAAACASANLPWPSGSSVSAPDRLQTLEPAFAAEAWEPTVVSSGTRAAIVGYAGGVFVAVERGRGVVGVLPRGMSTYLVDGHDAVYAGAAGAFMRAPSVAAALEGRFEPVAMPAAGRCRTTLRLIACADETVLRVSADEGDHFTATSLPDRRPIREVWPRADGVVVARVAEGAFVSFDRGVQFAALPGFEPRRADGPWIWNGDPTCPIVLGRDGRSVVRVSEREARAVLSRRSFGDDAKLARKFRAGTGGTDGEPPTPLEPPPPEDRPREPGVRPCPAREPEVVPAPMATCTGAACARAEALPVIWGRHALALFSDGKPHVAVIDNAERTLTIVPAPDGCQPVRLDSSLGISVLLCADGDETRVHLADHAGRFASDGKLDVSAERIWHLSVAADDGTVLLHETCRDGEPCHAWLRRPTLRGSWRRVGVPDAVAYRVRSNGRALAVGRTGTLWLIGANDELSPALADELAAGPTVAAGVATEVDPAGR